jgi:hypothetical protein
MTPRFESKPHDSGRLRRPRQAMFGAFWTRSYRVTKTGVRANRFAKCKFADSVRVDSYSMSMDSIIHTACGLESSRTTSHCEAVGETRGERCEH